MVSSAGGNPSAVFTIRAQDLASQVLTSFSKKLGVTNNQIGLATGLINKLTTSFFALSLAIPLVFGLLSQLVVPSIQNMLSFEQASRRARLQLRFMGIDLDTANKGIKLFALELDRTTATTLFQSKEAMALLAASGSELGLKMALVAQDLHDKFGIPVEDAFNAIAETRLLNDPQPLLDLLSGFESINAISDDIAHLNGPDLIAFLMRLSDEQTLGSVQRLQHALDELSALALPTKEAISNVIAEIFNIFLRSLVEHLSANSSRIGDAIVVGLTATLFVSGGLLGRRIAVGILGALGTFLVADGIDTIKLAFQNWEGSAAIALVATAFGFTSGKKIAGAVITALGLFLLPGIAEFLDNAATDTKLSLAAIGIGIILGKVLKLGFLKGLALQVTLAQVADAVGKGDRVKVAFTIAGAIIGGVIGAAVGQVALGAIVGALTSNWAVDVIRHPRFQHGLDSIGHEVMRFGINSAESIKAHYLNAFFGMFNDLKAGVLELAEALNKYILGPLGKEINLEGLRQWAEPIAQYQAKIIERGQPLGFMHPETGEYSRLAKPGFEPLHEAPGTLEDRMAAYELEQAAKRAAELNTMTDQLIGTITGAIQQGVNNVSSNQPPTANQILNDPMYADRLRALGIPAPGQPPPGMASSPYPQFTTTGTGVQGPLLHGYQPEAAPAIITAPIEIEVKVDKRVIGEIAVEAVTHQAKVKGGIIPPR